MEIRRKGNIICSISDDAAVLTEEIMQPGYVSLNFNLPEYADIRQGDFIEIGGQNYFVNDPLSVSKKSTGFYNYSGKLENEVSILKNINFLFLDEDASTTAIYSIKADFNLVAIPGEFLDLICRNMNRSFSGGWGWAIDADVDNEALKDIQFNSLSCMDALNLIAETYEIEWSVKDRIIRFSNKYEIKTGLTLQYPQSLLSPVTIITQEGETGCNRLFVYGSERNIPSNYGAKRLKMPNNLEYVEDEGAAIFPKEKIKIFDDVYPHRTGYVSAVETVEAGTDDEGNKKLIWRISDTGIDFDLKSCLKDQTAKISFTSGLLIGQEFEIASNYDDETKTMEIVSQLDGYGNIVPSQTFHPSVGDSYVILDIDLPEEYIRKAENELKEKAFEYFKDKCQNQIEVTVDLKSSFLLENDILLHPGYMVRLYDEDLGIDRLIRITKTERVLGGKEYGLKTKITLSSFIKSTKINAISGRVEKANRTIITNNRVTNEAITNISTTINNINDKTTWKM